MNFRNSIVFKECMVCSAVLLLVYLLIAMHYKKNALKPDILDDDDSSTAYNDWQKIAAHPWLTSNHSFTAVYANLHNDLDQLLRFMSNKTNKIALLRFSYRWQIMLQNQIYTLVRLGQVYNYIVMVGDEQSLAACLQLNLPCYNGTKYYKNYYKQVDPTVDALYFDKKHYQPMVWFKLRFYRDVLMRNYTILALDTDIAFSRKNIWLSLEKYSEDVGDCDMIFMAEKPVNTGFFYCISNTRTITLFNRWIYSERVNWHLDDQQAFKTLRGYYYELCDTRDSCDKIKQRKMIPIEVNSTHSVDVGTVAVRTFVSSYYIYRKSVCPVHHAIDPCLSTSVFVHTVCTVGQPNKIWLIQVNGFWLLEEHCNKTSIFTSKGNDTVITLDLYKCVPLIFNYDDAERRFQCKDEIAWT